MAGSAGRLSAYQARDLEIWTPIEIWTTRGSACRSAVRIVGRAIVEDDRDVMASELTRTVIYFGWVSRFTGRDLDIHGSLAVAGASRGQDRAIGDGDGYVMCRTNSHPSSGSGGCPGSGSTCDFARCHLLIGDCTWSQYYCLKFAFRHVFSGSPKNRASENWIIPGTA